jgi:protein-S-isoprenylcysteine O-methyltransferase Ste14
MEETVKETPKTTVHEVLAYSYGTYFLAILVGLFLNFLYPIQIFNHQTIPVFGFILLTLGTYLIYWAQSTSRGTRPIRKGLSVPLTKEHFSQGPYTFSSSPTHLGLTVLSFGFALTINSLMLTATTLVAFLVTRFIFVKKEEAMLSEQYGEQYREYRAGLK